MKRFLRAAALSLLTLLGVTAQEARASHAQGGDLRYESLGNNQYRVSVRYFRDCSGITAEQTLQLNCRVGTSLTSCASNNALNRTVTLQRQGQPVFGNQYCATLTGICTSNGPSNYEENTYVGTVTLPAEQWTLSVEISARPMARNVPGNNNMRFEATLDNRTNLLNNSPNFGGSPAIYVGWKQSIALNMGAFDVDGDSLAFSLVSPLTGCNTPTTYQPYDGPGVGNPIILSTNPGCVLNPAPSGLPAVFSPTFPIVVHADTTGSCPTKQFRATAFTFNSGNGNMTFTPGGYESSGASSSGRNKYVVAVKVDEYRRINGNFTHIGSARRELFITVYDCGTNVNPRFAPTVRVYGQPAAQPLGQVIPIRSGAATSLIVTAADGNAGQNLTLSANHLNLPGVYTQQLGPGSMALEFSPPTSLPDGTYYITVKAEDDNCPMKGFEVQTLAFRVYGSPLSRRPAANQLVTTAFPNPFTDQVSFTLARPAAQADATVEIVDQLGRVVERLPVPAGVASEAKMNWRPATGTPAGVYLARFPQGQQTVRLLYLAQ